MSRLALQIVTAGLSLILDRPPPEPFIGFTLLELLGAPLFIYWQHQVARVFGGP